MDCTLPYTIIVCLLIMFYIHYQNMETFATFDGIHIDGGSTTDVEVVGESVYKPWHRPGGVRYYMADRFQHPRHQNVMDYRGKPKSTKYVANVLSNNGHIPILDDDYVEDEYNSPSYHIEGFSYDMNRNQYVDKLDRDFAKTLSDEKKWRDDVAESNVSKFNKPTGNSNSLYFKILPDGLNRAEKKVMTQLTAWDAETVQVEGFGTNRSSELWNEKDYPIVTSNGLDLTSSFPQSGGTYGELQNKPLISKVWGDFDMLKPDDRFRQEAIDSGKHLASRTSPTHIKKNSN